MPTLRDIRRRITAVANTAKITQAMRMVSASKMRRAQEAIWSARPYVQKLSDVLTNLVESVGDEYTNPLIQKHKSVNSVAVVVIGSDRGLCGSFNTNLFRMANNFILNEIPKEYPGSEVSVIAVGKKACNFLKKQNFNVIKEYPGIFQKLEFSTAKEIVGLVSDGFINNQYDKVFVFFTEFKNLISQVPRNITLLPIEHTKKDDKVEEKYKLDYIFEPSQKEILDELLPKHLDIQMWRTLLESNAAEQASRMMAMENATNNARDLVKYLELVFNKARQAAITKEMLEIVSGAEALKK
ncbi:MAG: ATP synthase F1 subunit gamma [Ignavibacteria bacterium GWB2_35_12]|nr:MAG: ATP synthase F1 subunit gamma [Ignavibacteria bacterium GWB2_35_12]OGU91381.1 MAG: ATP synthase F1 subunit gamma [Ignavibacteria bacterium RIFOXYA2_FULL_35_10]OGV24974.1 MAG: ATP synthase F1 subunit gamma [Ignavibacteria bacterium RIFOXYC2_FULL_35_21]